MKFIERWTKKNITLPFGLTVFLAALLSTSLALHEFIIRDGWPHHHDGLSTARIMLIWAESWAAGIWFPIWEDKMAYVYGSAHPAIYHKLTPALSAVFYLLTNEVKVSLLLTIASISIVGCFTVYQMLRTFAIQRVSALSLAVMFPHLNYMVTNYEIRMALSEYCAYALVPLLITWCLRILRTHHFSFAVAPWLLLIYLAHSIIAYYAVFLILCAVTMVLLRNHSQWPSIAWRSSLSAIFFALPVFLVLLPQLLIDEHLNLYQTFLRYAVVDNFRPFLQHIYHFGYEWGEYDAAGIYTLSVQLDSFLLMGLCLLVWFSTSQRKQTATVTRSVEKLIRMNNDTLCFLLISCAFYILLQFRFTLLFYEWLPGAKFVQFPFRLLGFITLLLVAIFAAVYHRSVLQTRKSYRWITAALVVGTITLNVQREINVPWYNNEELRDPNREIVYPKYLPKVVDGSGNPISYSRIIALLDQYLKQDNYDVSNKEYLHLPAVSRPCQVITVNHSQFLKYSYHMRCAHEVTARFPKMYSGLSTIEVVDQSTTRRLPVYRTPEDPRIHTTLPKGEYWVHLTMPRYTTMIAQWLSF